MMMMVDIIGLFIVCVVCLAEGWVVVWWLLVARKDSPIPILICVLFKIVNRNRRLFCRSVANACSVCYSPNAYDFGARIELINFLSYRPSSAAADAAAQIMTGAPDELLRRTTSTTTAIDHHLLHHHHHHHHQSRGRRPACAHRLY